MSKERAPESKGRPGNLSSAGPPRRCCCPPGRQQRLSRSRQKSNRTKSKGTSHMLMTLAIILIALWLLGLVTSTTMGGLIHVLLVIAVIVVLVRLIQGRKIL